MDGVSGGCHKHFRTRAQAEAFIVDWRQTVAELYRREIEKALYQGCKPFSMELSIKGLLAEHPSKAGITSGGLDGLDFSKLGLE